MKIFTLLSVILGINFALADNSTIELLSTDDEVSRTQIMETDLSSGDKIKATVINKKFQAILKQYNISIVFDKTQEGRRYSDGSYASSCLEYVQDRPKYKGITGNGFYLIDRNQDGNIKKVYCNQEIDGGGWTLVAHKLGSDSGFFDVIPIPFSFIGLVHKSTLLVK